MLFERLKNLGILGINRRNANYTLIVNPRRYYPLVDDKLLTKELSIKNGIQVPELYKVIRHHYQIADVFEVARHHQRFVVKPSRGCEGEGILVLRALMSGGFERASGKILSPEELKYYISGILSGLYSFGGQDDKALIEYKVESDSVFEMVTHRGVPDVRIIVYRGVPVMSMLRLPTMESNGKANLHQGALGVGVDLSSGITLNGIHHNRIITMHPDTHHLVAGLSIPYWQEILTIATHCYEMTGLGYLGVDVVVDRDKGPMLLELNARPGLSIQIANRQGLLPRLEALDAGIPDGLAPEERVILGKTIADGRTVS
jgi:alpha-L-glutamate ligase-like protein